MQPIKKSLVNYISEGYFHATKKHINKKYQNTLNNIGMIDSAILILDDIVDQSSTRNKKPCLYKTIGIGDAIIEAEAQKAKGIESLFALMRKIKTETKNQIKISEKINALMVAIYSGEKEAKENVASYIHTVKLITGSHIKYGLEIGQLLGNKQPEKGISEIAISAGIIRQICDDVDDYYPLHHEPFNDFLSNEKRLPEIFFQELGGNREEVLHYIQKNEIKKARKIVLNSKVVKKLLLHCNNEYKKIKSIKTTFNYQNIIEDFNKTIQIQK